MTAGGLNPMAQARAVGAHGELSAMRERARRTRRELRDGRARAPVDVGLWIPTSVIFGILAPFALLLLPFLYLAPRSVLPKPAAVLFGLGAVLLSLGGTHIDVDAPGARIRIRLF